LALKTGEKLPPEEARRHAHASRTTGMGSTTPRVNSRWVGTRRCPPYRCEWWRRQDSRLTRGSSMSAVVTRGWLTSLRLVASIVLPFSTFQARPWSGRGHDLVPSHPCRSGFNRRHRKLVSQAHGRLARSGGINFLTCANDRRRYRSHLLDTLKPRGTAIVATFALDGADSCSGLSVQRYSAEMLAGELGPDLRMIESIPHVHTTPWGSPQSLVYCRFQRL